MCFIATDEDDRIFEDDEILGAKEILKAVEDKNKEYLTELLTEEGSNIHLSQPLNKLNQTVCHLATLFASNDIIGTLLNHIGEEIDNFVDSIGMNPVHYAARSFKNGVINTFLRVGSKALNSLCHKGMSPLMYALKYGKKDVLHAAFLLLKNELVNVSLRDKRGNNVLFYIAELCSQKSKKKYRKLIWMVLKHQTFTREMLTKPNKVNVSIIEHVANKDLIIMLVMIGKGKFYFNIFVILKLFIFIFFFLFNEYTVQPKVSKLI